MDSADRRQAGAVEHLRYCLKTVNVILQKLDIHLTTL
jgi:hypothetical protein